MTGHVAGERRKKPAYNRLLAATSSDMSHPRANLGGFAWTKVFRRFFIRDKRNSVTSKFGQ